MADSAGRNNSIAGQAARFVFRDVLFDIVRFPIWWYSRGLMIAARFVGQEIQSLSDRLSIPILIRNLFKPMFGDYSRSGRIISFFVRLFVFIFKGIGFLLWTILLAMLFVVWIAVPLMAVYQVVVQIVPSYG